jgi:hypothetical protein
LHQRHFVRNLDDEGYLETFLVSAIASILLLRFYLYMSGFPQVGGKGLHVAHTLWGGALMMVALAIVFNYLDEDAHRLAAVIGGAGFGIFIDELGKFITSDTNYFYQPSAAIIYVIFVVIYLAFRLLRRERNVTDQEYLINSLQAFQQALTRGYDQSYVQKAVSRLGHTTNDAVLVHHLLDAYRNCPAEVPLEPGRLQRAREWSRRLYDRLIHTRWFPRAVIVFFLVEAILTLLVAVIATWRATNFALVTGASGMAAARLLMKQADVVFATLASILVILGALVMIRSRVDAFRLFKVAMLVSIFLTQIFEFYTIQFVALFGLGFNILGLLLANTVIARERDRLRQQPQESGPRLAR